MLSTKSSDTESSTATSAADIQRKGGGPQEEKLQKKEDAGRSAAARGFGSDNGWSSIISGSSDENSGNEVVSRNAALSSLITSRVQPKKLVGKPDDKYEKEADSTARKVMRMTAPAQRKSDIPEIQTRSGLMPSRKRSEEEVVPGIQPQSEEEEEVPEVQSQPMEEEEVQRQPADEEKENIQRQKEEEEEKLVQRQSTPEEEKLQARAEEEEVVRRQPVEEEIQAKEMEEERPQRKAEATAGSREVNSSFESNLSGTKSSGEPLPDSVRSYMEPRFGADFSNVRIHTGTKAATLSKQINARAFTHGRDIYFNRGSYDPHSSGGRQLIAHELTHTLQQGAAGRTVNKVHQTSADSATGKVQRSWVGDAWDAVSGAASSAAEWVGDSLEAGKDWLMGWLKERVDDVPGYSLLAVVIGQDPLSGEHVPRTGRNFIEAGLDIIPNGEKYKQKLQEQGNLSKAASWLDDQLELLSDISAEKIGERFQKFWSNLGLTDVRNPQDVLQDLLEIFKTPINRIIQFAKNVAAKFLEIVKDYLLSQVVDFVKDKQSPSFYPLLTVVLGEDPITGEEVKRSGKNILTGFLKLHPKGDKYLAKMKSSGSFGRATRWINNAIARIKNIAAGLGEAFKSIWNAISDINTLLNPIDTFERIYANFRTSLVELASFMWTVGKKVLSFIKDALLSRLSAFAEKTRGFPLVKVLIGMNPFTGRDVPRTPSRIIRGFFSLMENGIEKFKKFKESGAIARLISWIEGAVERLNITKETIVGLFKSVWDRLTIDALMEPIKAFRDIVNLFRPPIGRIINFVGEVIRKVVEIMLKIMNFPTNLVSSIIERTAAAFGMIKRDPIGFIKNLLRGLKQGFQQFFTNIGSHLMDGLTDWLFGTLEEAGIKPPPDLSLKSIFGLVVQILGITKDKIFAKIEEKIGREKMEKIRGFMEKLKGVWAFVKDVVKRGPVAIWEYVQEKISNLWNLVFEQVKSWIMEKVIKRVSAKLLSMLDPSGVMAVVNSFIAIYRAIQSAMAYATKMLKMVNRFVGGIAAIARGNLAPAAKKVESALSKGVPIAIGFLANQVGLRGLGKKIRKMIDAVQVKVDKAIEWLIDKAMKVGGAIVNMGRSVAGSIKSWWKRRKEVRTKDNEKHEVYFEGSGRSAQLIIASEPKPYAQYLNSLKGSHDLTEEDIQPAKAKVQEIEQEKSKSVDEDEKEDHGARINNLMDELVDKTAELPLSADGGTNTPPVYGPLRNGFGTLARVAYLQAPHEKGSPPSVSNTPEFEAINRRRKGGGAYYVKGHLLNENLGGPGNTWSNLTPLTQQANADHKSIFENPVKKAVNGTISKVSNPKGLETKGHVRNFRVRAKYGRSLPSSHSILVNEDTDELPGGMPEEVDPFTMASVLEAEQHVPTQLECQAEVRDEEGNTETLNENIVNNINYGQLSHYSLNPRPRQEYVLADHIDFDANSKQEAVQQLLELNGIGPARAERIYDGLMESGTIYNYKKQIGITKKTIEKNNPDLKIKGGNI